MYTYTDRHFSKAKSKWHYCRGLRVFHVKKNDTNDEMNPTSISSKYKAHPKTPK
jgi:hypothetical protein